MKVRRKLVSIGCRTALVGLQLISSAQLLKADIAVNWGGDYVSAKTPYAGHTPANLVGGSDQYGDPDGPLPVNVTDSIAGRSLRSTPLSPPSGYSGTSGTFYGGGSVTRVNSLVNDGFSDLTMLNQGSNDSMHFRVNTGGDSHTFHLLTYWDKSDFLNGLNSVPNLTLDAGGQFTIQTSQSAANHSDEILRWVVREGSQFYVSQNTTLLTNNATFNVPYSSLTNWALYNPNFVAGIATAGDLSSLDFDETSVASPLSFSDITGIGFYIEHEAATGPIHVHIEGFEASLTAVPEPGSLAYGLMVGLGGLSLRRSRTNRRNNE
jgi:hypothetical protein